MDAKMSWKNKNKSAQVAIFIIIAIIIVITLVLLFVFWRKPDTSTTSVTDPESYIEECVKGYTEEAIDLLAKQGGDIEPEGSINYDGTEIVYLCYNANFYNPCTNQRPLLIEHIEEEITNEIRPKILACFSNLKKELGEKGYKVDYGDMEVETELQTKRIIVTIDRVMEMAKEEDSRRFTEFKGKVSYPLYELAEIATEIANQEAEYCNFENLGFMITYPQYDIRKIKTRDSSTIYTLKDIPTNKEFKFAIRSCALPAGF